MISSQRSIHNMNAQSLKLESPASEAAAAEADDAAAAEDNAAGDKQLVSSLPREIRGSNSFGQTHPKGFTRNYKYVNSLQSTNLQMGNAKLAGKKQHALLTFPFLSFLCFLA